MHPELVVCGARVLGVPGADSVAVLGGRIEAVGSRRGMLALRGPAAVVLDRPDALVCPGLHDAHVHLGHLAAARTEIPLRGLDLAGIRDAVARTAAGRDPHRLIVGRGFDPELFRVSGVRPRDILDEAAPRRAVLLRSHDDHSAALSTAGLVMTGFLPSPPEIAGGSTERDVHGEPTGLLRETAAVHASAQFLDVSKEELAQGVLAVVGEFVRAGFTAVHDMSGSRHLDVLRALDDRGPESALAIDVHATVSARDAGFADLARPGRRLRIAGMKAFLDGALGSRTAHLLEPYEGDACHRGMEVLRPDETLAAVRSAAEAGLPSFLHAIGDAAVRAALDALGGVRNPKGRRLLHRVEHAQMIHDADLPRFAALGVAASLQPVHLAVDAPLVHRHWGCRSREAFPVRRLLDSGATVAFGSDAPIETFDVVQGVRCAVTRTGRDGTVLHAEEAVTVDEALAAYSTGAAAAAGTSHASGAIRRGLAGDLTLLSGDPARRPESLADCGVSATIVRGRVAFDSEAGAA